METVTQKCTSIAGVSSNILKEIQAGRKLTVETIILESTQEVLTKLLAIDADFVLVLNTLNPVYTIEEIISFIEMQNEPITLLAFKFAET